MTHYTPLIDAIYQDSLRTVKKLLAQGADPNECDKHTKCPPLGHAVICNRPEMIDVLVKAGAHIDKSRKLLSR